LWTFMGYSKPYTIFTGVGEVIGGVLLFFRRTTTLGALIVCGMMANVVALNFSYDVGVKIFSSLLLFLAMFLLVPDLRRLMNVFVLNRPIPAANLEGPVPKYWMRNTRIVLHTVLVVLSVYWLAGPSLQGPRERGPRPKSPFYGLYQVEAFIENGRPLELNDANWRRVIFEGQDEMTILTMDDSMLYYYAHVDIATNTVTISGERDLDSNQQKESLPKSVVAFSWPDPDHLEFRGNLTNQPVIINMRKVDTSKFTLVSRGFHLVQNRAFYR